MQNVVDVASLSPPVVTAATKSAVQDPQNAGQNTFDMALKKASERIEGNQFKDANSVRESNSVSSSNGSVSRTKNDNSRTNSESEVKRKERKEFAKSEKEEKEQKELREVTTTILPIKVESNTTVIVENSDVSVVPTFLQVSDGELLGTNGPINTFGVDDNALNASTTSLPKPTENLSNQNSALTVNDENTKSTEVFEDNLQKVMSTETVATKRNLSTEGTQKGNDKLAHVSIDSEPQVTSAETYNRNGLDTRTQANEGKQTNITEKVSKSNVQSLESTPKGTIKDIEGRTSSSPPDTPIRVEGVGTHPAAQSAQINEPARLAEAPKNEVITQVTSQLDKMVKTNRPSLRLQLYPEELGHIDLKIVSTKNGVGVTMVADKASTQEFLRSEMNALKQNIEQAGIQLNNLNINQGNSSNKQQMFDDRQNRNQNVYSTARIDGIDSRIEKQQKQLNKSEVDYRV